MESSEMYLAAEMFSQLIQTGGFAKKDRYSGIPNSLFFQPQEHPKTRKHTSF